MLKHMFYQATPIKGFVKVPVQLLNQPGIKACVKNFASIATAFFGLVQLYDAYRVYTYRPRITVRAQSIPNWVMTADRVSLACAKISIVLSAAVSRPGVRVLSALTGRVFSPAQLARLGPNTIFAVNPWHPRHVTSLVACALALPSVAFSTCKGAYRVYSWQVRPVQDKPQAPPSSDDDNSDDDERETSDVSFRSPPAYLRDESVRLMNLFNFITARPTLHIVNDLASRWLR